MQSTVGNGPSPAFGRARLSCKCVSSGFEYSIPSSHTTDSGTGGAASITTDDATKIKLQSVLNLDVFMRRVPNCWSRRMAALGRPAFRGVSKIADGRGRPSYEFIGSK